MRSILSFALFLSAFASWTSAQSSSTVCTQTGCNQDNCFRNIQKSTAFCASFTGGAPVTTTAGLNPSQASCGPTRLSSACSCLYPSGATSVSARASITQCTVISLAPSPTVFNYDFQNPPNPPVSVFSRYNVQSAGIVSDTAHARSPPNVLKAQFLQEQPNSHAVRNIYWSVTGAMRPFANYTFSFWASQDAGDTSFDNIAQEVFGLKNGPVVDPPTQNQEGSAVLGNGLLHPGLSPTYNKYSVKFRSGEYLYYYIVFYFNNANPTASGNIPSVYVDDLSLVQT